MKKPADQKGLRARLTVIETGFNPSAYTALLKNDVNSSDNVEGIQVGLIARKQQSGITVPEQDRESVYIELNSRNDNRRVTVRFNEEPVQDHLSQRKHTTGNNFRNDVTHINIVIRVLQASLENPPDWKESSHHLQVQESERNAGQYPPPKKKLSLKLGGSNI